MKYLLDTNAVIAVLNDSQSTVARHLKSKESWSIGISSLVAHELYYGAHKSRRKEENIRLVDSLFFEVVSFDKEDAQAAGEIRAVLAQQGQPIGPYDVLIAGQALARGLTLVTNNIREFQRVSDLLLENWSVADFKGSR